MAKVETVELANPIELFGKKITALKIKEPTGRLYIAIGEPRIPVQTGNGGGYYVEQPLEIGKYLEACIDHEMGADLVPLLSLEDIMEVKKTIFDFFDGAAQRRLERRLIRLSSGSESTPSPPSKA
jgi:hypothetical protein